MRLDSVEIKIQTYKLDDDMVPKRVLKEYGEQKIELSEEGRGIGKTKKCFIQSDKGKHFEIQV